MNFFGFLATECSRQSFQIRFSDRVVKSKQIIDAIAKIWVKVVTLAERQHAGLARSSFDAISQSYESIQSPNLSVVAYRLSVLE